MIVETRSVNFGAGFAGLTMVGYRLRGGSRTTAGVSELPAGSGSYVVMITRDPDQPGYILWDTGGAEPAWAVEELNPSGATTLFKAAVFGTRPGLATVGYQFGDDPRSISGVTELAANSGIYGGEITFQANDRGYLVWDTGEATPLYAVEAIDLAVAPTPTPTPAPTSDFDFLEGLIHAVAVQYDVNAAGATTDADGDREEDWQSVDGLAAVQCRVVIREPKAVEIGDRPAGTLSWKVLFGQSLVLDQRNRLVYVDPDDGTNRYGYVQSRIVNAHGMNHHWVAKALEYPI